VSLTILIVAVLIDGHDFDLRSYESYWRGNEATITHSITYYSFEIVALNTK
jgi:hypothetical protein